MQQITWLLVKPHIQVYIYIYIWNQTAYIYLLGLKMLV